MIGKIISHYRIIEELGRGGMGVVYKAEDTKLKRTVALKFLPPDLTRDPEAKARFIREAQAAAALNHPHICTIYEIDEHDSQSFIVMEFVEGDDLKDRIQKGPLPIDDLLSLTIQIGEGLHEAHEKGIIHRDIKPGNIMLTRKGEVKIMDFGLAKLGGRTKLTKESSTLGTVAYMSPEQARGEQVDQRTDIWALGVVLYEMISGQTPFKGEYEPAVVYSIMNEVPTPLTGLRSGVSLELERIVTKCLEKNAAARYQHADDLIVDLKKLLKESTMGVREVTGRPLTPKARQPLKLWIPGLLVTVTVIAMSVYLMLSGKHEMNKPEILNTAVQITSPAWKDSIAVLPFKDYSPQRDQEYFCDGMTEDIITKLSKIRDLKVISRTSVLNFKNTNKSIREIGKELAVSAILEGSIQKEEKRIRINAQLIRTADDAHLWAERYDRQLESVFDIQDEISLAIVNALELKLTSREKQGISNRPIDNVAAYQCYLKADPEIWRFDEAALERALQYLREGIAIVGDNALLYSALALVYWQYVNIGIKQEDYITQAEEYAEKALALDPDFPKAHEVLATIYKDFLGNTQEAIPHYQKSLEVNPNEVNALRKLAYTYIVNVGKPSAAIPLMERAKQVDPLEPFKYLSQGMLYFYNGQYQLALEQHRKFYEADTKNPLAQFFYAWMLICNNQHDEAFSIIDESARSTPDNVCTKFGLLLKYVMLKDKEKAFREMNSNFQKTCKRDPEWSYYVALMLSSLDAPAETLDWLENAINRGFINYPVLEQTRFLDNYRGEERFKKLMARVKFEWEHFEL